MLLTQDIDSLTTSVLKVKDMASKLGLILSIGKSSVFATSNKLLNQVVGALSHHNLIVGQSRNLQGLGVNFQTSKLASIDVRTQRWISAKKLLDRLQYMPWTAQRKTQIVCRCILPHTFFGIENTFAGKDFLREVRAKCNHSVGGKQQYHLHYLAPLFSGDFYEPFLYVANKRFSTFTRNLTRNTTLVKELWKLAIRQGCFFKRKTRGCVSILQNQLHELGWALAEDGKCTTPTGHTFMIWDISTKQFRDLALESWELDLLRHLHEKQNLQDLESLSIKRTCYPEHKDPMIQGFMKKVRLGGLFPNKRLQHLHAGQDEACVYCGQEDTMQHRVYHCPGTEHIRQGGTWDKVKTMPKSLILGGLFPKLQCQDVYCLLLDSIEPPVIQELDQNETATFFTDGSASDSSDPATRLCAWAVTQAQPLCQTNNLLYSGLLPGRYQTVFRAELYAVIMAMASHKKVHIYSDNSSVVKDINHILSHGYQEGKWSTHPDRDLFRTAAKLIDRRGSTNVSIQWVKAHRDLTDAVGSLDLWQIFHNSRADYWAGQVFNNKIPLDLLQVRQQLREVARNDLLIRTAATQVLRAVMDEF